jgi:glycosyltransferase involved in cell wall biosynthesis
MDRMNISARKSLRVAAIIANESVSGPGRQLTALAAALGARGAEFLVVILHRTGNPPPPLGTYLEAQHVPHTMVEDRGPLDLKVVQRVRDLLTSWQPCIVQTHGYKATAVAHALRSTGSRWPWIGFFHGETHEDLKARFYHWLDHRMLASADRIVVMSQRQHARFAHLGGKARVIHNAVLAESALDAGEDSGRLSALLPQLERPVLGVVGRLSPEKGVDVFLDACALLRQRGQQYSALIAGVGPDEQRLRNQATQLGLDSSVHFLGSVHNVRALYDAIDVLVLPSRSEGLPNVLLEALGADRPVLCTRVGAVPEVLTDTLAGIIVPPNDADALGNAVMPAFALRDRPDARAARVATANAFSLGRRVQRHIELYRDLAPFEIDPVPAP